MTRRQLLEMIAGGGIAAVGSTLVPSTLLARGLPPGTSLPSGNPLRIPETFSGDELRASIQTQQIFPGIDTTVWTYGGSAPGPTIRVRRGDNFSVRLRNDLQEETIIHWHGQIIPHEMDGHPSAAIQPGETFDYSFDILNRAGTYFYHPHPHEHTGRQATMGLGGFFIVTDEDEEALGLPSGEFDVPLMVQDRIFTPEGELSYDLSDLQRLNGLLGDTILVNGTPDAYLEVSADLYRFRVLNGCNARILRIGFETNDPFTVIGTDGGLLSEPYQVDALYLAPAERLDIIVDFTNIPVGSALQLMSLQFGGATTSANHGYPMSLIRFDVTMPSRTSSSVPEQLADIVPLNPAEAVATRLWQFQTRPVPLNGHYHHINNLTFEMMGVAEQVGRGDLEIWEIENAHTMPHPVHIHGVQFQVLERINGQPMLPRDYGWKDVILVWGRETVRLIMRNSPFTGLYLIHCHNLEHEDEGMMLNYEVIDQNSSVDMPDKEINLDLQ